MSGGEGDVYIVQYLLFAEGFADPGELNNGGSDAFCLR
jgi:hypothetical protein